MDFGYFTLSDNRYPDNPRDTADFFREILGQSLYAEEIGMHSVWVGEHHFNRRGVISVPAVFLSHVAGATKRVRLGPAVVVLPIHHPIHVAEEWASLDQLSGGRVDFATGRGYDSHEFTPFSADFQKSAELFSEGLDLLERCWNETEPFDFNGEFYQAEELDVHPKPAQVPFRPFMGSFSKFSMEIAADRDWNLLLAPFASSMIFGGLDKAIMAYREICEQKAKEARRIKCSYFIHIGESQADRDEARGRLVNYFSMAGMRKKTSQGGGSTMPPTMQYFAEIGKKLADPKIEDFDESAILLGSPERIINRLKEVEEMGVEEVILYFNFGMKSDALVREQMDQFMRDIAPAFEGAHTALGDQAKLSA
ncbi:MAG: LLM class flavin-dependent oxidoreductase [Rhodospirillaceae bacterium]|jgi:alkanesulfonate monooxygenase SsuD/methylene tetrahydromethanopterin reductase-like flavin-dependent oxidoreductase (luciferase family)|nr:LLM class flavin-dependent oxidoreductase [Rhodospirillaceae bacterium]MBT5457163.1 LLM class flavin-dependent oxidoreductase [Rhodospirillaceae bacterium]